MNDEIVLFEDVDKMQQIANRIARGEHIRTIHKSMGITRAQAMELYERWKMIATNDAAIRERARSVVAEADTHYDHILREYWSLINEAEQDGSLDTMKIRNAALKNVADVTSKRVDFLARAGLLEDQSLADELAETEQKIEAIKNLLTDVAGRHPEVREEIMEGLSRIFGRGVGVVVQSKGEIVA